MLGLEAFLVHCAVFIVFLIVVDLTVGLVRTAIPGPSVFMFI